MRQFPAVRCMSPRVDSVHCYDAVSRVAGGGVCGTWWGGSLIASSTFYPWSLSPHCVSTLSTRPHCLLELQTNLREDFTITVEAPTIDSTLGPSSGWSLAQHPNFALYLLCLGGHPFSVCIVEALVGTFNQERALVGAVSVIVKPSRRFVASPTVYTSLLFAHLGFTPDLANGLSKQPTSKLSFQQGAAANIQPAAWRHLFNICNEQRYKETNGGGTISGFSFAHLYWDKV